MRNVPVHGYGTQDIAEITEITICRAQEQVKNMYAITYTLPRFRQSKLVYLGMDDEQSELCRLVVSGESSTQ